MGKELFLENFGKVNLVAGIPPGFSSYDVIPSAIPFHAKGPWGILCLQEIKTPKYSFRHFLFLLKQSISIFNQDNSTKLQSLLTVNGSFHFQIKDRESIELKEKEYLLFVAAGQSVLTTIHKGRSAILNTHYTSDFYRDLVPYFSGLKDDLQEAVKKPYHLKHTGKIVRRSVHDAIKAIWREKYIPALQPKQVELHLAISLFSMLAQSYDAEDPVHISPTEKQLADEAKKMILQDLKHHLTPAEIAARLNCSASSLRKKFRKVHGIPMFKFLRTNRMHYAREQLLSGASLKLVSIELGMNPSNFPKEFKAFFGYTVSSLKKGQH